MRILVTGGAGFIGSALTWKLIEGGHEVTVFDNLETGDRLAVPDAARLIVGDIRDQVALKEAMPGHEAVVHLAAMVSVARSVQEPDLCRNINVDGTRNVLEAARRGGVRRFVLASTAAVYGNNSQLPKREELFPEPASPYAFTKWINEIDARFEAEYLGLEAVCLRFFNVYGPRQRPDSPYSGIITIAIDRMLRGQPITIFGDGQQTRDFVYVEDVAVSIAAAVTQSGLVSELVNIGTGERISLLQLLETLEGVMGERAQLSFSPSRPGDVRHSVAYVARMLKLLGMKPTTKLERGLQVTVEWARRNLQGTK